MRPFSIAVALALVTLAACVDLKPCTNCPKIEGDWVFGHTLKAPTGDCTVSLPPPPGTLKITRAGARIYSTTGGVDLAGTIYEDDTFTLRGPGTAVPDAGTTELSIRGEITGGQTGTPADAGADGGTDAGAAAPAEYRLTGKLTTSLGSSATPCKVESEFTAVR